jgi:hypothetical protein
VLGGGDGLDNELARHACDGGTALGNTGQQRTYDDELSHRPRTPRAGRLAATATASKPARIGLSDAAGLLLKVVPVKAFFSGASPLIFDP